MHRVSINEVDGLFLEIFRVALSAGGHEVRVAALKQVKNVVIAERLKVLSDGEGPSWVDEPDNQAEPPRVYRRVKHSKDEPHDEETMHPRLSG